MMKAKEEASAYSVEDPTLEEVRPPYSPPSISPLPLSPPPSFSLPNLTPPLLLLSPLRLSWRSVVVTPMTWRWSTRRS
jgi:hypothetical protein